MKTKIVANIGNGVYLVEGFNKWGLYNLKESELCVIDSETAKYLINVSKLNLSKKEKMKFISNQSETIYKAIFEYKLDKNIFEKDESIIPIEPVQLDLVWLEITEECNEKCIHCYAECGPSSKKVMPLDTVKDVLFQIKEAGFKKCQIVGGEPFMHKNIWEILNYAYELQFVELEIFTNLTIPKFEDLRKLKEMNIKISTTLLGNNSNIHDSCTKTEGSFEKLINNLRQVKKLEFDYKIGVIKMKQNESSMNEIKQLLLDENLISSESDFTPDTVRQSGRGSNNNLLPETPVIYTPYLIVNSKYFHRSRVYHPCWRGELAVSAEGFVYPCVFTRDMILGNINTNKLQNIINEQKETTWKINLDKIDKCKDCEFRYACMDCRALSIGNGLGLYGAPVRCDYNPYL